MKMTPVVPEFTNNSNGVKGLSLLQESIYNYLRENHGWVDYDHRCKRTLAAVRSMAGRGYIQVNQRHQMRMVDDDGEPTRFSVECPIGRPILRPTRIRV